MDHETDSGEMARAETRWRKRLGLPAGLIERAEAQRMTLLLTVWWPRPSRLMVTLVTCIQLLYLESLRLRTRELPALQFFKETLEARDRPRNRARRADVFAGQAHRTGHARLPDRWPSPSQNAPLWEALAGAFLLTGLATVLGAHI